MCSLSTISDIILVIFHFEVLASAASYLRPKNIGVFHVSRPKVIKLFSWSTQLSMNFQLLLKTKILPNKEDSCFKSLRCCIYREVSDFSKTKSNNKIRSLMNSGHY